jgi:ATP-dependent Lon protease
MKDFMANGRFSRGVEVIADASMAFVGNIDLSVEQIVNSEEHDLFQPLPPRVRSGDHGPLRLLSARLGDAEEQQRVPDQQLRLHHRLPRRGLPLPVQAHEPLRGGQSKRIKLGKAVEGRDEKGIKKTVCAFLKILHPHGKPSTRSSRSTSPTRRGRRRVKEQMNKRKPTPISA